MLLWIKFIFSPIFFFFSPWCCWPVSYLTSAVMGMISVLVVSDSKWGRQICKVWAAPESSALITQVLHSLFLCMQVILQIHLIISNTLWDIRDGFKILWTSHNYRNRCIIKIRFGKLCFGVLSTSSFMVLKMSIKPAVGSWIPDRFWVEGKAILSRMQMMQL